MLEQATRQLIRRRTFRAARFLADQYGGGLSLPILVFIANCQFAPAAHALTKRNCAELARATEKSAAVMLRLNNELQAQSRAHQISDMADGRLKEAALEAERARSVVLAYVRAYTMAMDAQANELQDCAR